MGIIQGLTEFLPVSSTAHLVLLPWFFNWTGDLNTLTFDVALHSGTLASLLICFWRDWIELITKKQKLLVIVITAAIPAGIAGFLLNDIVENSLRSPHIIAAALIFFGIVMMAAEKIARTRTIDEMSFTDALVIGTMQAVALIPGVSRSGITISAGLFKGFQREAAARFSFLVSTPLIAGATLLHARKLLKAGSSHDLSLFLTGFAAAAVSGYAAIRFLMGYFRRHSLNAFACYRFCLASVIIAWVWLRN